MPGISTSQLMRMAQRATMRQANIYTNVRDKHKKMVGIAEKRLSSKTDKPWEDAPDVSIMKLVVMIIIYAHYEDDGVLDKKELKELKKVIKTLGLSKEETNELMQYTEKRLHMHELDNYIEERGYQPGSVVYAAKQIKDLELRQTSNKVVNSVINNYNEKRDI